MLRQHSMIKNVVAYYRVRVFITLSLWSPGRASDVQSLRLANLQEILQGFKLLRPLPVAGDQDGLPDDQRHQEEPGWEAEYDHPDSPGR